MLPIGYVKCLLVLGGGPEFKRTGRLWVSRMGYDEITQYQHGEELVEAGDGNSLLGHGAGSPRLVGVAQLGKGGA